MGHETELKFVGPEDALTRLHGSEALRQVAGRAQTRVLNALYFDTEEHALRKAGYVLRVRKEGDRFVQTVKASNGLAVATRLEVNNDVDAQKPDVSAIKDRALRRKLLGLVKRSKLKPLFGVDVRRTMVHLTPGPDAEIEAAFDVGEIKCGEATIPISELELELLKGDVGALVACARALTTDSGLVLTPQSKAERGFVEVRGTARKPVSAESFKLPATASADEAFAGIIGHCLRHMMGNWSAVLDAHNPEGVHQMRVALRRLRSAFVLFAEPFRPALGSLEAEVRWIGEVLGRARDLDVFLTEVFAPVAAAHGGDMRLNALSALVRERRAQAWEDLFAALTSERYRRLVFELTAAALTRPWAGADDTREPAGAFARDRLSLRYERILKAAKRIERLNESERHELRIELKKLRYAVDFFESLWPDHKTKRFLKKLSSLQDVLGEMNDAAVARALVGDLLHAQGNGMNASAVAYAAGVVVGWHVGHSRARAKKLAKRWASFVETRPPWEGAKRSKASAGVPKG